MHKQVIHVFQSRSLGYAAEMCNFDESQVPPPGETKSRKRSHFPFRAVIVICVHEEEKERSIVHTIDYSRPSQGDSRLDRLSIVS